MKVKVAQSCMTLCDPMDYTVHGILQARILEVHLSLLQGIFLTQGSNLDLLHHRWSLYLLNHKENAFIEHVKCQSETVSYMWKLPTFL